MVINTKWKVSYKGLELKLACKDVVVSRRLCDRCDDVNVPDSIFSLI